MQIYSKPDNFDSLFQKKTLMVVYFLKFYFIYYTSDY
jgi:hypothetical protein